MDAAATGQLEAFQQQQRAEARRSQQRAERRVDKAQRVGTDPAWAMVSRVDAGFRPPLRAPTLLLLMVVPLALGTFTYVYSVKRGELEARLAQLQLGLQSRVASLHADLSALSEKLKFSEALLKEKHRSQQQLKDRRVQQAELQILLNETLPQLRRDIQALRDESKSFRSAVTVAVNEADHEVSLLKTKLEDLRGSMLRNTKAIIAQSKDDAVSEEKWALRNLDALSDLNLEVARLNESHWQFKASFESLEKKMTATIDRYPEMEALVNAVDKLAKDFERKKRKTDELESWLAQTEAFMARINGNFEKMQNLTF
ncbi:uncharacterized protein LOC133357385 isoform X2 [Lethenteron reissneri]|uniref:uncharacterized protein LOC133357385 isoform X2 n=1 Tax=Lethenteron reissneri TaxID=7753 RepID=UPI002AB6B701|nr:uncharacterized protein LOC133357385 isoform X2 [Lethenteron reissneri]